MAMVVRSNLMAINANRQLGMNNSQVSKSLEKLSSGFRINRAGDDASGLAISEKMKAQIKGLEQASSNSQDGISLVQTAEGAMTEVHNMLNRMVELATKSANGTISDAVDRDAIQAEVDQLSKEIDRIGDSTNFNGINLLDGNLGASGSKGIAVKFDYAGLNADPDVKDTTGASAASSVIGKGTDTSAYTSGDEYTMKLTISDADGNLKEINAKFKAGDVDPAHTNNDTAIQAALAKEFGDGYTVAVTGGDITITSKTPGAADKFKVLGAEVLDDAGAVVDGAISGDSTDITATINTAGEDAFDTINFGAAGGGKIFAYDGNATTKIEDHVFEVNGEKFAFVQNAAAQKALLEKDPTINTVLLGTPGATTVLTGDASKMADLISAKTGINASITLNGTNIHLKAGTKAGTNAGGLTLQVGDTNDSFNKVTVSVDDVRSKGLGIAGIKVNTQESAGKAIQTIKSAINKVSTNRGNLGALQNRLEYAINNLDVTAENMTNANSRIRDTDMAKEMMNYTKMNVLTQSAQAMLAQANQSPQSILQLLQ